METRWTKQGTVPTLKDMERERDKRGFTLIEILIAMAILTIALVALAGELSIAVRSSLSGKNVTIGTNLAQQKMEEFLRMSSTNFSGIADAVAGSDPVSGTNPDSTEDYGSISGYPSFKREVYITDLTTTMKDLAVRVLWREASGGEHPVILRTIIAK